MVELLSLRVSGSGGGGGGCPCPCCCCGFFCLGATLPLVLSPPTVDADAHDGVRTNPKNGLEGREFGCEPGREPGREPARLDSELDDLLPPGALGWRGGRSFFTLDDWGAPLPLLLCLPLPLPLPPLTLPLPLPAVLLDEFVGVGALGMRLDGVGIRGGRRDAMMLSF